MYTVLWFVIDLLFVVFVILHLAAKRQIQMLSHRNDLEVSQIADQRRKWTTRVKMYKGLWMLALAVMIIMIVWSVTGNGK